MVRYRFRCHMVWGHNSEFEERLPDDAAAEARAIELCRGKGRPAPYIEYRCGGRIARPHKAWWEVEVYHANKPVAWLSAYGEQDMLAAWRDEDGKLDFSNPDRLGAPIS